QEESAVARYDVRQLQAAGQRAGAQPQPLCQRAVEVLDVRVLARDQKTEGHRLVIAERRLKRAHSLGLAPALVGDGDDPPQDERLALAAPPELETAHAEAEPTRLALPGDHRPQAELLRPALTAPGRARQTEQG